MAYILKHEQSAPSFLPSSATRSAPPAPAMDMNPDHHAISDLRHLIADKTRFPPSPDVSVRYAINGCHVMPLRPSPSPSSHHQATVEEDAAAFGFSEDCGGSSSQGRWPRQETLSLLEIRLRLDPMFTEAAQKATLWDEVSRIMAEEHGYQRSGKRCREKLENLYKYYKKTKEGKAAKQDGKNYRFSKQLEALYGKCKHPIRYSNNMVQNKDKSVFHATVTISSDMQENHEQIQAPTLTADCPSFPSSTEHGTSFTDDDDNEEDYDIEEYDDVETTESFPSSIIGNKGKLKRGRTSWRVKLGEYIEQQVRRFMEVQEEWLDKMLKTLEQMEEERISREEAWRKKEAERLDREHRLWTIERTQTEARNAALIEALENTRKRYSGTESPREELTLLVKEMFEGRENNFMHHDRNMKRCCKEIENSATTYTCCKHHRVECFYSHESFRSLVSEGEYSWVNHDLKQLSEED